MADDSQPPTSRHRGPAHSSPYPQSRLAAPISLVDAAREIERADGLIHSSTQHELIAIADQIRELQARARQVVERAREDGELHRARCNFTRIVGKIYHLYERASGERFFSMLSPEDWGDAPPDRYLQSYRLEADQRWTPVDQLPDLDAKRAELADRLNTRKLT